MTNGEWRDFRKVPVKAGRDRYVPLTHMRIFATDMFAVALVDSTGRLADPATLRLTPSLERARTAANMLVMKNGGERPYSYTRPPPIVGRASRNTKRAESMRRDAGYESQVQAVDRHRPHTAFGHSVLAIRMGAMPQQGSR